MLPRKPRNLPAMPKGYTYLGKGETFKTNCLFDGYYTFDTPNCWHDFKNMRGWADCHYCAPSNSAIVKLNGGAPKRKKVVKDETMVFNKFKYYGVENGGGREVLIATSYGGSSGFSILCPEQFANHNARFGNQTFAEIVKHAKDSDWKIKQFDTFAELCLWLADHPASKKVYS